MQLKFKLTFLPKKFWRSLLFFCTAYYL